MTTCKLCLKKIPKVKGHRSSKEPEFGICKDCQKRKEQIIMKYGVDQSGILNATIRSLIDCNSMAFGTTEDQLRLKHRIWAVNGELEDTFPGIRESSGQTRLNEFGNFTKS